jgi:hypothetical protein
MDFLDISSLGVAYRYAVKIEQKFKHQNKREFGYANLHNNQSMTKMALTNSLTKNSPRHRKIRVTGKTKKDTEKWCDFHKIPWHNTNECHSKQSLLAEIKDKELNPNSESDFENTGKGQIIAQTPLLLSRSQQFNQKNQQILKRGSAFFIQRCG